MDSWRLILHSERSAADNMAIDDAILTAHAEGRVPPTVRLYAWEKCSISLGYFQDMAKSHLDLDYCREAGVELVRRPTGGRAVVHGHDLTFSVCVDDSRTPSEYRGVLGSHVWLMRGIVTGFAKLGIPAEIGPGPRTRSSVPASADCFAHTAECDVRVADGTKVAGAAQVRRTGVLLEQGSVPHLEPLVDYGRVFGLREGNPASVLAGIPRRTVEEAMIEGLAESLEISFEIWDLTACETEIARQLACEKYASDDWTYCRV